MKQLLHILFMLLLALALAFANSSTVLADGGEGEHALEMEVNGIHVTLASQNDWKKGEDTITVTLTDSMGIPVTDAEVEVVIEPNADGHAQAEADHAAMESSHGVEQGHESMPGMDMGEMDEPAPEDSHGSAHSEGAAPVVLSEFHHGTYVAKTHLESSGANTVSVMFHVNGEMLEADFIVEVAGANSKTIVLWGFVAINVLVIASAGMMKKQTVAVKGR